MTTETSDQFDLGPLADPAEYQSPLDISGYETADLIALLKSMKLIRLTERCLAKNREKGLIGGPVHLGVGQEAVAVGVSAYLRPTDRVFGAHRSHSHLLALGSSVHGLLAEVLGKDTGLSRGMGGSMHLWDQPRGFYGSVPIVAGTVPLAVGAGLAAKLQSTQDVAVSYLGDGAVEEGVVHESLNLAKVHDVPVIFVIENNLFASHMHISQRQPAQSTARFGVANGIPSRVVDGNDVIAVGEAADALISAARQGNGPGVLEAVTYRWYGHVDWREDIDVGVNRSQTDVANWRARDPINRLLMAMIDKKLFSEQENVRLDDSLANLIEREWEQAMVDPFPEPGSLIARVYEEAK